MVQFPEKRNLTNSCGRHTLTLTATERGRSKNFYLQELVTRGEGDQTYVSSLIFLRATVRPEPFTFALYTTPYVPSPIFSSRSNESILSSSPAAMVSLLLKNITQASFTALVYLEIGPSAKDMHAAFLKNAPGQKQLVSCLHDKRRP